MPIFDISDALIVSYACECGHDLGIHIPDPNRPFAWPCRACECNTYREDLTVIMNGDTYELDGCVVHFGATPMETMVVAESPTEVYSRMQASQNERLMELSHHGEPETKLYVDLTKIIALKPHWRKIVEEPITA